MIFTSEHPYNPAAPYQFFIKLDRIEQAAIHFRVAHDSINHRRKYTLLPYWTHTEAVAQMVESVVNRDSEMGRNMIIAALGHDFLEDVYPVNPMYDLKWLIEWFSNSVACMIIQLTDVYTKGRYPQLNRETRKHLENQRLAKTWPEVQTIKLADLIDNTADITKNDPNFSKTYMKEKADLLPLLTKGNKKLWAMAYNQINKG